jgi:preprotein translocase subunit SecG
MFTLSSILIIIGSIIMILIVLAQNSKGGGLSSTFGGGSQVAGVQQTNKFLDKATWGIAIALLVFSITASLSIPRPEQDRESAITRQLNELNQTDNQTIVSPEQVKDMPVQPAAQDED